MPFLRAFSGIDVVRELFASFFDRSNPRGWRSWLQIWTRTRGLHCRSVETVVQVQRFEIKRGKRDELVKLVTECINTGTITTHLMALQMVWFSSDLKKAIDTIEHTILIRKLLKYGVDSSSLKWFESYLCDRNQKCSTNGHLSNTAPVTCGVPQGSNLGINDLPNCLSSASPRIFADDTNIITFAASTMTGLENTVNLELRNLQHWLVINGLRLNIAKTEFMVIGSNQRIRALSNNQIDIEIDGNWIDQKSQRS